MPKSYRKRISELMAALRRKYGFERRERAMEKKPPRSYPLAEEVQMALF